jgi:hypothetical protein
MAHTKDIFPERKRAPKVARFGAILFFPVFFGNCHI